MDRRSTPIGELRVSARITPASRLTPEEVQQTISEVKEEAAKELARLSHPMPAMLSWRQRPMTVVALLGVAAVVWAVQIAAMRPPARQVAERDRETGLRYTMALQVIRVEAFRKQYNRLPLSQGEIRETFAGMSYARIDSARYAIIGVDSPITLRYRSDSSLRTFLGNSVMSIRDRRKQ